MPYQTTNDVHVSTPMTQLSVAYIQSAADFVASRVFPNIPVQKEFDRYYVIPRGDFNRVEMKERAHGTESAGGDFSLDNTPSYSCRTFSVHKDIPDAVRANADTVLNVDRDATIWLTQQALLKRETAFVEAYLKPGVWANDWTGVASNPTGNQVLKWSDDNSDPIRDVRKARRMIKQTTGYMPNKITLGREVYDVLMDNPDIIDRLKYGQTPGAPAMAGRESLARLFELDDVLIMDGVYNAAKEGAAESSQFIGGKRALLTYSPAIPGLMTPSAGYTFSWVGYLGAGAEGNQISSYPMPLKRATRMEINMCMDQKVIAPDLGFLFDSIVA